MVIAWCRDTGIFDKFLDDRMPHRAKYSKPLTKANKPLIMTQILPFMAVYGLGIALSIIALMGEKVANIGTSRLKQDLKPSNVPITQDDIDITEVAI